MTEIRIRDLATARVDTDTKIRLITLALEELAIAHALVLIHGERRGMERYYSAGGHVTFDADGEPVLQVAS